MFPVDGDRDPVWQGNGECEGVTTLGTRTAVQPIGKTRLLLTSVVFPVDGDGDPG